MWDKRTLLAAGCATLLLLCGSCAGVQQTAQAPVQFPPVYEYQVYPFEVQDAEGIPLNHPFLGGFNLPRPQLVDIDGDDDLDLFLQELTGNLMHLENVGSAEQPAFRWRSNKYLNLDIGEWYRFVDIDRDGDMDLLGEQPYSYVRLFRNEGSPTAPVFTTVIDSLRDAEGVPLFADRQNIPSLADLDCDGLLDLFVGRVDGTVYRYESVGDDSLGLPRLQLVNRRFEDIEIVAQFGSLHGANALTFHDVDDDGDLDLFWGDFWEPGVLLIRNTGTCAMPDLRNEPEPFPLENPVSTSGYNATLFADINGDKEEDFFVGVLGGAFQPNRTTVGNFYFLESTQEGFQLRTEQFIGQIDIGSDTAPAFADLDGDGDLDMLLSNKIDQTDFDTGHIFHYENLSSLEDVLFRLVGRLPVSGYNSLSPALADLDSDGDLDMFTGTWNDGIHYYRNDGTAQAYAFVGVEELNIYLTRGSYSKPALTDIDADGDQDLFIGESSGELNFYRNTGSPSEPRFELVSDNFEGIDAGRMSAPSFTDLDGDGDQDMVLGREAGEALLYMNVGTPEAFVFEAAGSLSAELPFYSTPAFVDIDGDGAVDLFSGGMGGGLLFYKRIP